MTAAIATALYGFTDSGASAHMVVDSATRLSGCGRYLSYIPLSQPETPTVCRLCVKFSDPHMVAAAAMSAEVPVEEPTGPCSRCGSDEPLNNGLVIPHGVARMRKGVVVHTPERCPGAGHAPEVD